MSWRLRWLLAWVRRTPTLKPWAVYSADMKDLKRGPTAVTNPRDRPLTREELVALVWTLRFDCGMDDWEIERVLRRQENTRQEREREAEAAEALPTKPDPRLVSRGEWSW